MRGISSAAQSALAAESTKQNKRRGTERDFPNAPNTEKKVDW